MQSGLESITLVAFVCVSMVQRACACSKACCPGIMISCELNKREAMTNNRSENNK